MLNRPARPKCKWFVFLPLLILLLLLAPLASASQANMTEAQAKTRWLFKIAKYTAWSRPDHPGSPIIISFLGNITDRNNLIFPDTLTIQKKKIIMRHIDDISEITNSHILFISESEEYQLKEILDYTRNKDILTVGDTGGFADKGVIINFNILKGAINLEINRDAEKESGIELNPQLFEIAGRIVGASKNG